MTDKKPDAYKTPDLSMPILERVKALEAAITNDPDYEGPDSIAARKVKLLHVSPGRTEWELPIELVHCNKTGNLHGGSACIILDNLTSTALLTIAKPGFLDGGHVSRTITMSYLRPVPLGSTVKIVCEVVAAGRNKEKLRVEIQIDGKPCVTCVHDKAVFQKGAVHPKAKPKL